LTLHAAIAIGIAHQQRLKGAFPTTSHHIFHNAAETAALRPLPFLLFYIYSLIISNVQPPFPGQNAETTAFLESFEVLLGVLHVLVDLTHAFFDSIQLF